MWFGKLEQIIPSRKSASCGRSRPARPLGRPAGQQASQVAGRPAGWPAFGRVRRARKSSEAEKRASESERVRPRAKLPLTQIFSGRRRRRRTAASTSAATCFLFLARSLALCPSSAQIVEIFRQTRFYEIKLASRADGTRKCAPTLSRRARARATPKSATSVSRPLSTAQANYYSDE